VKFEGETHRIQTQLPCSNWTLRLRKLPEFFFSAPPAYGQTMQAFCSKPYGLSIGTFARGGFSCASNRMPQRRLTMPNTDEAARAGDETDFGRLSQRLLPSRGFCGQFLKPQHQHAVPRLLPTLVLFATRIYREEITSMLNLGACLIGAQATTALGDKIGSLLAGKSDRHPPLAYFLPDRHCRSGPRFYRDLTQRHVSINPATSARRYT
jgi:hypothetical protein